MDETLQELENELKRLTPRRPSAGFTRAVSRDLAVSPAADRDRRAIPAASLSPWKWAFWSLVGIAAAGAVLTMVPRSAHQPMPASGQTVAVAPTVEPTPSVALATNRYEPVQASSVLYDLQEGQPTTLPDHTEGRTVRYRYVDTYTWKNPSTNASLRWSVPRDEVRLIRTNLD